MFHASLLGLIEQFIADLFQCHRVVRRLVQGLLYSSHIHCDKHCGTTNSHTPRGHTKSPRNQRSHDISLTRHTSHSPPSFPTDPPATRKPATPLVSPLLRSGGHDTSSGTRDSRDPTNTTIHPSSSQAQTSPRRYVEPKTRLRKLAQHQTTRQHTEEKNADLIEHLSHIVG